MNELMYITLSRVWGVGGWVVVGVLRKEGHISRHGISDLKKIITVLFQYCCNLRLAAHCVVTCLHSIM